MQPPTQNPINLGINLIAPPTAPQPPATMSLLTGNTTTTTQPVQVPTIPQVTAPQTHPFVNPMYPTTAPLAFQPNPSVPTYPMHVNPMYPTTAPMAYPQPQPNPYGYPQNTAPLVNPMYPTTAPMVYPTQQPPQPQNKPTGGITMKTGQQKPVVQVK